MAEEHDHLKTISEIKSLMENSSKFLSLSGLSGIFAGIFALIGAAAAFIHLNIDISSSRYLNNALINETLNYDFVTFFFIDAISVLILTISFGTIFTVRNARKKGLKSFNKTSVQMAINVAIPLIAGGIFCLILVFKYHYICIIAPATLIFYGLACINGSKYTYNDVRYLGISEIVLGLIATYYSGYGLLFWALGFGVLHIVYGALMYFKYERRKV